MEERMLIRGFASDPEMEREFVELEQEYVVLWAHGFGRWAVSLEKAAEDVPEGTPPFRARAMTDFVRSGWHNPIHGLNYHEREEDDYAQARKSAETLVDNAEIGGL